MIAEFHNKPSVVLRGNTWDVKHLDNFLASNWGEKLFNSKRPTERSAVVQPLPQLTGTSSIRPSAAFLTLTRSQPPILPLEKPQPSSLIYTNTSQKSYTPPTLDIDKTTKRLQSLESQRKKDEQEILKVIPPSKRRQLFEAEKHRNKQYLNLKHEKILETKKERVICSEYRSGVLGVNSERMHARNVWVKSVDKDAEKGVEERKVARAMNIMNHTAPSANIQFFNSRAEEVQQGERNRGLRRVEEIPQHYHDTYNALFVPKPTSSNPDRTQRLKELWRGNREFDIVSGAAY